LDILRIGSTTAEEEREKRGNANRQQDTRGKMGGIFLPPRELISIARN
jgi:hypothetical protein